MIGKIIRLTGTLVLKIPKNGINVRMSYIQNNILL